MPENATPTEGRLRGSLRTLLQALRVLSWGIFVYTTPGMLLVVALVAVWLVPGVVILLALAVLQVPLYLIARHLIQPRSEDLTTAVDPRFSPDAYFKACTSADCGSSRST